MNQTTSRDLGGPPGAASFLDVPGGRFHLLAIGIGRYKYWSPLPTAVNGAEALAKILQERYGFDKVKLLLNEEATLDGILRELRLLATNLEKDDSVVVAYDGHGHKDNLTSSCYWIPYAGLLPKEDALAEAEATWVSQSRVKEMIKASPARHILLVGNSCFGGGLLQTYREAPPTITDQYVRKAFATKSRHALTAGGLERVTEADGGKGLNPFGERLNSALAENASPYLCASSIHERIRGGTVFNSSKENPEQPLFGVLLDTGAELGGEFVFFRKGCDDLEQALAAEKKLAEEASRRLAAAEQARKDQEAKEEQLRQELERQKLDTARLEKEAAASFASESDARKRREAVERKIREEQENAEKLALLKREQADLAQAHRKAAESGDAQAMIELGDRYYRGKGVPANLKESIEWYLKAAEKGHPVALWRLACCHGKGLGTAQNDQKAAEYLFKAAEQGHIEAAYAAAKVTGSRKDPNLREILGDIPW